MAKIPIKFKRVAAAFDEAARWWPPCDSSSGSEYWPESGTDLSNLVNSFIEKGDHTNEDPFDIQVDVTCKDGEDSDVNWVSDNDDEDEIETRELLQGFLLECAHDDDNNGVKQRIRDESEIGLGLVGDYATCSNSNHDLKRSLMAYLRDKGFDAGLCKSRWEKTSRIPAGSYEYIDVKLGQARYIVEVFLAAQFEIARPTTRYTTLVEMIPSILIIEKPNVLKQILSLMSNAMKKSLKHVDMHVPPWRRNGYIQAKYFGPYKRTTSREPSAAKLRAAEGLEKKPKPKSKAGFEANGMALPLPLTRVSYYCRDDDVVSKRGGVRVGLLGAVLQGR